MAVRAAWTAVVALALATASWSSAASSSSVVSASVLSASSLDVSGCASEAAGITEFGAIMPGSSVTTSIDCRVVFGSSNDTSTLRMFQRDGAGSAMFGQSNGALDTTFDGPSGSANGEFQAVADGVFDEPRRIVRRAGGGLLMLNYATDGVSTLHRVSRYLVSGAIDPGFGGGTGTVTLTPPGTGPNLRTLNQLEDGRLIVGGRNTSGQVLIGRLTSSGSLDGSFGAGGWVTIATPGTAGFASDRLGGGACIGIGGHVANDLTVACVTENGTLDANFDGPSGSGNGIVTIDTGGTADFTSGLVSAADGDLLLYGRTNVGGTNDLVVIRLDPITGSLDAGWDGPSGTGNGIARVDVSGAADVIGLVHPLDNNGAVVTGTTDQPGQIDSLAVRLTSIGALDTSFSGDGIATINLYAGSDAFRHSALLDDGGVAVTTTAGTNVQVGRLSREGAAATGFGTSGVLVIDRGGIDASFSLSAGHDGSLIIGFASETAGSLDTWLRRVAGEPIPDYAGGATDWDQGSAMFGACLRAAGGATGVWTVNAACAATDGPAWKPVVTSAALADSRIATTAPGVAAATVDLRFGLRVAGSTPSGRLAAPVTFEVVAPGT